MAINQVYPENYTQQLERKAQTMRILFNQFQLPPLEIFESPAINFRMRAEFKIWHESNQAHYAMYEPGAYKKPFIIDTFPIGSATIIGLMPKLLEAINDSESLARRLFQVEFLTTTQQQCVITLIYHCPLSDEWENEARLLADQLGCSIIGRSRKQKRIVGQDFVLETFKIGGREFTYQQVETGFTQPNAVVCEKMLNWAYESAQGLGGDLLELYCGNGNFTLPLACQFDKVLATEISKTSVNSALYNINKNAIDNISVLRMSSEEFVQAMDKVREFRRLRDIDLDSFHFSTIFVDPPRAGLDQQTLALVQRFDNIIYVSCNPETLRSNMDSLQQTHEIKRFALFDQFPYTDHIESGVLLQKKQP